MILGSPLALVGSEACGTVWKYDTPCRVTYEDIAHPYTFALKTKAHFSEV